MDNLELLFKKQGTRNFSDLLYKNEGKPYFKYKNSTGYLNDAVIKDIIGFCNLVCNKKLKLPVFLDIGNVRVVDKLSYIVLECIVYQMLQEGYSVNMKFNPETTIDTNGIKLSPLMYLNELYINFSKDRKKRQEEYCQKFIFMNQGTIKYRRLVTPKDSSYLSKLTSDLIYFLKNQYEFRDNCRKVEYDEIMVTTLANTIGELVGNAIEHGGEDCILDIDITHDFTHANNHGKKYGAVNIAIVNFSNINFSDKVKVKILNTDLSKNQRYQQMYTAYTIHKSKFNSNYTEEHFWSLVSLQDKISGRPDHYNNGGKGSTELIKSIQKFTHEDYCYVMSGREIIYLKKEFLKTNSDGFVCFNRDTFLNNMPDQKILGKSKVYFPGVAYNLNFILEEMENESY